MRNGSPRKRNRKVRYRIPNFTKSGNWSRRACIFDGADGRLFPETLLVETEKGWVCTYHYDWYFTRRFEDDTEIDIQEVYDEK